MAVGSPEYDNTLSGASDTWDNDNASPILYADYFNAASNGNVKIWNGAAFVVKPLKVWDGLAFTIKPAKTWNGTNWVETSY